MTMASPLPRITDITGAGNAALIAARPGAAGHLVSGRYGDVVAMWKAQITLALRRLADECKAGRVPLATGVALRDLLASEFDAVTSPEPQKATGTFQIARTYGGTAMTGGLIRAGTKFRRAPNATASPAIRAAEYETAEPVFVARKASAGTQTVALRVRATQAGTAANIQADDPVVSLADTLFWPNWTVVESRAAGGSDGVSVAKLRSLAQAMSLGQYGPTLQAIAAGCLLTDGVSRVAVKEYDDPLYPTSRARAVAWIADDSWCWSDQLAATALQRLNDDFLGFGCKAQVNEVTNEVVSLAAPVRLRDKRFMADTVEIADNARAALLAYFNDRPDWWTFNERSMAAAIVRSDRRILEVPAFGTPGIVVTNVQYGTTVSPPPASLPANPSGALTHYELDSSNVEITFMNPT